ncbi:MAG: glycerate kinase, partial [Bacteroidota bacterium]
HTNFEAQLKGIDYIITGEGKIDHQTLHGKLIAGITQLAQRHNIPVIALCGALLASPEDIKHIGLRAAFSIQQRPVNLSTALAETSDALTQTAFQIGRLL